MSSYDLSYRPSTYFDPEEPICRLLRACSETEKAVVYERVLQAIADEDSTDIVSMATQAPAQSSMEDALYSVATSVEALHYDATMPPGSTVIACVTLYSTLGDTIRLSAFPTPLGIGYVPSESMGGEYTWEPKESTQPLTMNELVKLMDTADCGDELGVGMVLPSTRQFDLNSEAEIARAEQFVEVSSVYYPDLAVYYRDRIKEEIAERVRRGDTNSAI